MKGYLNLLLLLFSLLGCSKTFLESSPKPNINRLKANNLSDKVIEELIAKHKKIKHKLESLTGAKLCREVKA